MIWNKKNIFIFLVFVTISMIGELGVLETAAWLFIIFFMSALYRVWVRRQSVVSELANSLKE